MAFKISFICSVLSALPSTVLSVVLPPVNIPSRTDVAITSAFLTDTNRRDPFAKDGRARSIVISSFYPVPRCRNKTYVPYMPPTTAAFQDEKFAAYGLPNGTFQSLSLPTCADITYERSCGHDSLPLVLFSGALGTSRLLYTSMLQTIAAAGSLVISVDHPYDADIVEFPNGIIITGTNISSDADVELAVATRAGDMAFLHRQMANATVTRMLFPGYKNKRIPKAAVIGHSLGGAAAAATMLQVPALRGGVNIDGTMFGPVLAAGLNQPFMLMGHDNKTRETDPSWNKVWPQLRGWKKEFEVRGAAHYSFSDFPLITSVLGLASRLPPGAEQLLGSVEGHRMMEITTGFVTAFLDMVLKSGHEGPLLGEQNGFPEVAEVK